MQYCGAACQAAHWRAHRGACAEDTAARVRTAGERELEGAEDTLQLAIKRAVKAVGGEGAEALHCMGTYALFLRKVGRYDEAGALSRKVLEAQRRTLGDAHPSTLDSIDNLAKALQCQKRHGEAEPLHREALGARRRELGDLHHDTLATMECLSHALRGQGKLREAESLCREAVAGYRRKRGDNHPNTADAIASLALLLQKRGKLAEAEPLFREALEQYLNAGDTHCVTLHTIYHLACLLQASGPRGLEEAEALLRETLGAWRAIGDAHPNMLACSAACTESLGAVLLLRGRFADAERLLCEAYEGKRRVLGDAHPRTREALGILAGVRRQLLRRRKK